MKKRDKRAQIVIIENGQYVLLKQHYKKENHFFWVLPGGGKEDEETIEEAAIREAKEETGLDIKLLPFIYEFSLGDKDRLYNKKVTLVGYPIQGDVKLGYDSEEDRRLWFNLVDIKWHPIKDIENIDAITRQDVLPVKSYLENNDFVKRAGTLVYKEEAGKVKYLLVSMRHHPNKYTIPQGHVEKNETYIETAIRETKEEGGVLTEIEKDLGYFFYENKEKIYQTYIYLGKFIKKVMPIESRDVKWLSFEETLALDIPKEARRFLTEINQEMRD